MFLARFSHHGRVNAYGCRSINKAKVDEQYNREEVA